MKDNSNTRILGRIEDDLARCYINEYRKDHGPFIGLKRQTYSVLFSSQDMINLLMGKIIDLADQLADERLSDPASNGQLNFATKAEFLEVMRAGFAQVANVDANDSLSTSHIRFYFGKRKELIVEDDGTEKVKNVKTLIGVASDYDAEEKTYTDLGDGFDFSMPCPPYDCNGGDRFTKILEGDCDNNVPVRTEPPQGFKAWEFGNQ